MKKFKELIVKCNSREDAIARLVEVGQKCKQPPFGYSEEIEKLYDHNDKLDHIHVTLEGLPEAILLLYASEDKLKVINIVPFNHSCDQIEKDVYNQIVTAFEEMIIRPLFHERYTIVSTQEEITMPEIIPNSYDSLYAWVNSPGAPHSPFSHKFDLERWFHFLCTLHVNGEELTTGELEQWLIEECHWNEDIVEQTIIRYETELDLLGYYDRFK